MENSNVFKGQEVHTETIKAEDILKLIDAEALALQFIKENMSAIVAPMPAWENKDGELIVDKKVLPEIVTEAIATQLTAYSTK
jgi:hypothetical protein